MKSLYDYVGELHAEARRALKTWADSGKQSHGSLFDKQMQMLYFKNALRFIKRNENTMRSDFLARELQNNNVNDFWKEIRKIIAR